MSRLAVTCLAFSPLVLPAPLAAQVTTPVEDEEIRIDSPDSPPVSGPEGVGGVTVEVTPTGSVTAEGVPAILGQGPDWRIENWGLLQGDVAVDLREGGFLQNAGTIEGDIFLGTGDATLRLVPGGAIQGNVDAGGGNNVLELGGGGTDHLPEYDGSFAGFAELNVGSWTREQGNIIWTLTGDQQYTGGTEIFSGGLKTMGQLDSDLHIRGRGFFNPAAEFWSAGTVTGDIDSSGVLVVGDFDENRQLVTPEGSDRLAVGGDVILRRESTLVVITGETRLEAAGSVSIEEEEGATSAPSLLLDNSNAQWRETYLILRADGGVTGEFGEVTSLFRPFLKGVAEYGANEISVTVEADHEALAAAGATRNQRTIGRTLAALDPAPGSALEESFGRFLETTSAAEFGGFAESMSGEIIATGAIASGAASHGFRSTLLNTIQFRPERPVFDQDPHARTRQEFADAEEKSLDRNFWTRVFGVSGDLGKAENAGRADYTVGGVIIGADMVMTDASRAGAAFSYARSRASGDHGKVDGDVYQLALYGTHEGNSFIFDGTFGYAFHDLESQRIVRPENERLTADYTGNELFGSLLATLILEDETVWIMPVAGVHFSHFRQGGFRESGTWALAGGDLARTSLQGLLGVRILFPYITARSGFIVPEARFHYTHELLDREAGFSARFTGDESGTRFSTRSAPADRNYFQAGAGVSIEPSRWERVAIFADYDGFFSSSQLEHVLSAGFRLQF